MKKIFIFIAFVVFLSFVSCEQKNQIIDYSDLTTTMSYLPGNWKINKTTDSYGVQNDFDKNIIIKFGPKVAIKSDNKTIYGDFELFENNISISNGNYALYKSDIESKPEYFVLTKPNGELVSVNNIIEHYIVYIDNRTMIVEEKNTQTGLVLKKSDKYNI